MAETRRDGRAGEDGGHFCGCSLWLRCVKRERDRGIMRKQILMNPRLMCLCVWCFVVWVVPLANTTHAPASSFESLIIEAIPSLTLAGPCAISSHHFDLHFVVVVRVFAWPEQHVRLRHNFMTLSELAALPASPICDGCITFLHTNFISALAARNAFLTVALPPFLSLN